MQNISRLERGHLEDRKGDGMITLTQIVAYYVVNCGKLVGVAERHMHLPLFISG